jgi:hypothetical protein
MVKHPVQSALAAGLLFCLAFSMGETSSAGPPQGAASGVQLACDDGLSSREVDGTQRVEAAAELCGVRFAQ